MTPSLDLTAILVLLGAAQGILLALALVGLRHENRAAIRLLAAFFAIGALSISYSVLVSTRYLLVYPHLSQVTSPLHFLIAPLLFLYVRTSISRKKFENRSLLHFIPFGLCFVYYLPLYLRSGEDKLAYITAALQNYPPAEWRVRSVLLFFQALPYLIFTLLMFFNESRKAKDQSSAAGKLNLLWLRVFLIMILALSGAGIFRLLFNFRAETMLLFPLCFSIMVYVAAYMALKHPEALAGVSEASRVKKYEKSSLPPERAVIYLNRLLQVMETEKLYRKGDLTVQKLADRLSIPPNHLSQIINERLGLSFADFVNAYRVKEVQEIMVDPAKKHYSLLAIAEEVGFKSKSAFNAVFKKHANMTPSEFRKIATSAEKNQPVTR